jgi:hypothetical protein
LQPPGAVAKRRIKLRLTFARNAETVVYEYIEFKLIRLGTDEVELESVSDLPFTIGLQLPFKPPMEADFSVIERFKGGEIRAVAKALRAFSMLRDGAQIEIYDLEHEKVLGKLQAVLPVPSREPIEHLVWDAEQIAEKFGLELRLPSAIKRDDFAQVAMLKALIDGAPLPVTSFSAKIVKTADQSASAELQRAQLFDVLTEVSKLTPEPRIFGVPINTGPITLTIKRAVILKARQFWKEYRGANQGEPISFRLKAAEMRGCLGPQGHSGFLIRPASPKG